MILLYETIPDSEIKKDAEEIIPKLEQWFLDHPQRQKCKAGVWYGHLVKIRRNHVREDVEKARDTALKNNHDRC